MPIFSAGSNPTITVQIVNDSGIAVTGLAYTGWPATSYQIEGANASVSITLSALAAITTAYTSGGVFEIGGGYYRLDAPAAMVATAGTQGRIIGEATGLHIICPEVVTQPSVNSASNTVGTFTNNSTSPMLLAAIGLRTMTITGTFTPSLGAYFYKYTIYNNQWAWLSSTQAYFLWYNGTNWIISTVLGTNGTYYWTSSGDETGSWTAGGSATGAPVLTCLDAPPNSKNFPLLSTLANGSVNSYITGGASGSMSGYLFTADAQGALSGNWIAGTATTSPATKSVFGTCYTTSGGSTVYNGKQVYQGQILTYIWWDSTNSLWTISAVLGTRGSAYFTSPTLTPGSTWTAGGTATGSPAFIFSPIALLAVDSSGQVAANAVNGNVTGSVGSVTGNVGGNVSGSVASVTGNVGGNVSGSVGSVTGSVGSVVGNVGGNVVGSVGSCPDTSGTTTLLSRITSSRAGYLDNLNVGGAVASHSDVLSINLNASKHVILMTAQQYAPGEAYTIELDTFSASTGGSVNADSTPTISVTGSISGSLAANLGSITNPATGVYRVTYTVPSSPNLEQIRVDASATISASTFTSSIYTQAVDSPTAIFTATDKSTLTAIYNKLPANQIADQTLLASAIGSPLQTTTEATDAATLLAAIGTPAQAATLATGTENILSAVASVGAGGNVNVSGFTSNGINALKAAIAGVSVSVVSPVVQGLDGSITVNLVAGDDYYNSDGRAIYFPASGTLPDWTGGTAAVEFGTVSLPATIVTNTGSSRSIYLELSSANTANLAATTGSASGNGVLFDLVVTLASGRRTTVVENGLMVFAPNI